nr:hypothetical protein MIMGU_mgv1a009963mg [Ipomoea trifida]
MASIKSSSSLDFKFLFVLCSLSHLSAAQSISSAVFLIAFSYPPKSIHLSHGIKSDTNVSPNSSNRFLMDFKSWLSSATSSSPKSMAMERLMISLENHCFISTTTAPEIGSLLEQFKQDYLSDFTPVLPVWGNRKHGVVVAHDFRRHEFGPRCQLLVFCPEAFPSNYRIAHHHDWLRAESHSKNRAVFIRHGGQDEVSRRLPTSEQMEMADYRPCPWDLRR